MRRSIEVADIFRRFGEGYREAHDGGMALRYLRAMTAIEVCRSSQLGGHVDECDRCGELRISYNSCRNRHCPKCQSLAKERWLQERKKDLLPVSYFHVVFTLPEELRPLALRNQKVLYNLLFKAVAETLIKLGKDPKHLGAQLGFIAILHTWSQTLIDHPHIHCIVPGGGLSPDGKSWISCRKDFFIHVKVLSRLFRRKLLWYLKKAYKSGELVFPGQISPLKSASKFKRLMTKLHQMEWNVYCKPPFGSPEQVLNYLGRYTHRVAISNERIVKLEGKKVTIRYRDSGENNKNKLMTLDVFEFIRRFLLHILPDNFMKIRHYGILSNRNRKTKLKLCKKILGVLSEDDQEEEQTSWEELFYDLTGIDPGKCPSCGIGKMIAKRTLLPPADRSPPSGLMMVA